MRCRPAITSMSLGRAWKHELVNKLDQAALHGFEGIELFYEDLEYFAKTLDHGEQKDGEASQLLAARRIKELCEARNLSILCLQPFMGFEGLRCPVEHAQKIDKLKLWFRVAKTLQTDMILIPSTFLPADQLSSDLENHIADLREAADLGAKEDPPIKFAYESLAWGTFVDTWETCWDIVQRVDRPNFGICLDTFQIAGRVYADPTSPSGTTGKNAMTDLRKSIKKLTETIQLEKLFFVQLVSGERLEKPLLPGHEFYAPDQPPRMSWSRNCRLFYGEIERGDYLPVKEVAAAMFDPENGLGYTGWVSMELFSRSLAVSGEEVPKEHAQRGIDSWRKFAADFRLVGQDA